MATINIEGKQVTATVDQKEVVANSSTPNYISSTNPTPLITVTTSPQADLTITSTGMGENAVPTRIRSRSEASLFKISDINTRIATYRRTITDTTNTVEQFTRIVSYKRTVTDSANVFEQFSRIVNYLRTPTDRVDTQDSKIFTIKSVKISNVNTSESIRKLVTPAVTDSANVFNPVILTPKLLKTSSGAATDTFSRIVNYLRTLTDQIKTTDDYLGIANIDDDEYAFIGKSVADQINTLENIAKRVTKPAITDSFNVSSIKTVTVQLRKSSTTSTSENFSRVVNYLRTTTDQIIGSESVLKTVKPSATETVNISVTRFFNTAIIKTSNATTQENTVFTTSPIKSSLVNTAETLLKSFSTEKFSSTSLVDTRILTTNLLKFSSGETSDTFSRIVNYLRTLTDQIKTTDDYLGLANIDDDEYAFIGKSLADQINTLENITKQVTKPAIADSFNVSSIKTVTVQLPKSSSSAASETFSKILNYLRTFTDPINLADQFIQNVTYIRTIVDGEAKYLVLENALDYLLLENGDFLIQDPFATIVVESLGETNTQNYFVDGLYTEPGYTGTITTFTA
jgi:DNA-binding MltR family transcriptional regulator